MFAYRSVPLGSIVNSKTGERIGIRKVLVFCKGKPPKGIKTRWIMHEFRLADAIGFDHHYRAGCLQLDEWVLCRIYHKPNETPSVPVASSSGDLEEESFVRETNHPKVLDKSISTCSFSNMSDDVDLSFLHSILQEDNVMDSAPTPLPLTQVNTTNHSQVTFHPVPSFETGLKRECPRRRPRNRRKRIEEVTMLLSRFHSAPATTCSLYK